MKNTTILPRETHTIWTMPAPNAGLLGVITVIGLSEEVRRGKRRKHRTLKRSTVTAYRSERKRQYRRAMRRIKNAAADLDYAPPQTTRVILDRVGVDGLYDRSPVLFYDPSSPNERHRHGKWCHRPYNAWLVPEDRRAEVETACELFPSTPESLQDFFIASFRRLGADGPRARRWDVRIDIHRNQRRARRHYRQHYPQRRPSARHRRRAARLNAGRIEWAVVSKYRRKKKYERSKRGEKRRCGNGLKS